MGASSAESVDGPTFASELDAEAGDDDEEIGGNSPDAEAEQLATDRELGSEDAAPDKADVDVAEAVVEDTDFGDLVTGTETASSADDENDATTGSDSTGESDGDDDAGDGVDPEDLFNSSNEAMETAINEGLGRLAVQGLDAESDEYDREAMQQDFTEIAEAFRVGYFGSEFADEYVFTEGEKVDPTWGLLGSMAVFGAFVLMQRPDGDEKVQQLKDAISNIGGGGE